MKSIYIHAIEIDFKKMVFLIIWCLFGHRFLSISRRTRHICRDDITQHVHYVLFTSQPPRAHPTKPPISLTITSWLLRARLDVQLAIVNPISTIWTISLYPFYARRHMERPHSTVVTSLSTYESEMSNIQILTLSQTRTGLISSGARVAAAASRSNLSRASNTCGFPDGMLDKCFIQYFRA